MYRFLRNATFVLALGISLGASSLPAQAIAPKEPVSACDLGDLLGKLAAIKQDGSSTTEATELDLRKQIMGRSMECNAREATALAGTVGDLAGNSGVANTLKKRYQASLNAAAAYAAQESAAAASLESVAQSKERANALKAWRADTYNPLAWEASQLIILDRNMGLAKSGEERVKQLTLAATALGDNEGAAAVRGDLEDAGRLIKESEDRLASALVLVRNAPQDSQEQITGLQKEGMDGLSQAYKILLGANTKLAEISPAK